MQLIRNPQTRKQLWSRQARATRWGISCVFPKAHDEPVAVAEANYTVDYAKMLESGNKSKVQDPETGDMVDRGGGLSPATVIRIHNILNAALEQAKNENKIAVNPVTAAKPPRIEKKEMKVLSQDQVTIFLQSSK